MPYFYRDFRHQDLIYKFKNSEKIERNYSQAFQDMFAITMFDGKLEGTFLDIGCHDTSFHNNTFLLEKVFNWKGFGIDLNSSILNKYKAERKADAVCANAVEFDYKDVLQKLGHINYLSLDIDPPHQSIKALYKIFSYEHKIDVITFEHDAYLAGDEVRAESRKFLIEQGYKLIVPNVMTHEEQFFEDWWVHNSFDHKNKFLSCIDQDKNMPLKFFYKQVFSI